MAQNGTLCDSRFVPTPTYRVESVSVVRENRLHVSTQVAGDAALSVEHGDALNPSSWALMGPKAPKVAAAQVAHIGTADAFFLDLDAPLVAGTEYSVALQPWARSAGGQTTDTAAVAFVAPASRAAAGVAADAPGADIAFPPIADSRGDLVRIDRAAALHARVLLFVSSRRASFAFASMERFGRGLEPKRTYGPAKLLAEAAAIRSALLVDPDVRSANVTTRELAGAVIIDVEIEPSFGGPPVAVQTTITAGEAA